MAPLLTLGALPNAAHSMYNSECGSLYLLYVHFQLLLTLAALPNAALPQAVDRLHGAAGLAARH